MAEIRIRKEDLKAVSQNRDCEGEACSFNNKVTNDEPACEHKVYEDDDD